MQKQVVIVNRNESGNSFGDRFISVQVELRQNGMVIESKEFKGHACEGEHASERRAMTNQIKNYAKVNGTKFTGQV